MRCYCEHLITIDDVLCDDFPLEYIRQLYVRVTDPESRRRDRYYCEGHTERSQCAVYISHSRGVLGSGHIGWAYKLPRQYYVLALARCGDQNPQGNWIAGSVDNSGGKPIVPRGEDIGYWQYEYLKDLATDWRAYDDYDEWKTIDVADGNFEEAYIASNEVRDGGYKIVGGNCMDEVYKILTAFGADMPLPALHTPNSFFQAIPGRSRKIK